MENRTQNQQSTKGHSVQANSRSTNSVPRRNLRESVGNAKNKQTKGLSWRHKDSKDNRSTKENLRRNNKMFPTDINMRNSDTQAGELQERKRHNKRSEELEERGQNMQIGGSALNAAGRMYGGIGGAAMKALLNHPE